MEEKLWKEKLTFYDQLIELCPDFDRKGKTMPYTSANGYMFSLFNKAGEIGIRLPKESAAKFMETYQTTGYKSYGATMRDYVLVPESMYSDPDLIVTYLKESFEYVMSLKTPPRKKK